MLGMSLFYGIFFLVASLNIVGSKSSLCPVSSRPNFTWNHDHHYPMEIYFPHKIQNGTSLVPFNRCLAAGVDGGINFSCPLTSVGCPLIDDNIMTGLSASHDWKKSTSFCSMRSKIKDPKVNIDVIVFGGSVTSGVTTAFCCPLPECRVDSRCAWPHFVEGWLQFLGPAKARIYNLAKGGTTSDITGEKLQEYFDHYEITKLTNDTIVFVDHSFNDYAMRHIDRKRLERGLEKLVRRLLTYTPNVVPSIVLMETDTRAKQNFTFYPTVYRTVAKHYGLRVYSYLEAMRSPMSVNYQKVYHQHLTHKHRNNDHPAWHTHLIYADFVSSLLLHEMNECDTTYKLDGATPFTLPVALSGVDDTAHCNAAFVPLLRVSYDDIQAGTVIGDYSIPINGTWQVRPDRKGRGGIIAELNATDKFEEVQNAPLWLTTNLTVGEWKSLRKKDRTIVLQVSYLKSYVNSGSVSLNICGEDMKGAVIDSLWHDWKTYHYTTTEVFTWNLDKCNQPIDEKIRIGVKRWVDRVSNNDTMGTIIETAPRTRQLFKINSISVCRYN